MKHSFPSQASAVIVLFITATLIISNKVHSQETNLVEISGQVTEQNTGLPLAGVSINLKGTVAGTITSDSGYFKLRARLKFPVTLVFSSVGFQTQEFIVNNLQSR